MSAKTADKTCQGTEACKETCQGKEGCQKGMESASKYKTFNPKIVMIGSGNIGGVLGMMAGLQKMSNNIVMLDIFEGLPKGKALDMAQAAACQGVNCNYSGFLLKDQCEGLRDADVCIVTAGYPRLPGMTRDELLGKNAKVISDVAKDVASLCPNAFVVCITNPLDVMVNLFRKVSGLPASRVVGMAGVLDTSRFRYFLAQELGVSPLDVHSLVLGGHGDDMVPLRSMTSVNGIPLANLVKMGMITDEKIEAVIERTKVGGGEIVKYLEKGSAFVAPAISALSMVESYLRDEKRILPCCAYLQGEYGMNDIYGGVPVIIGAQGVERVLEVPLTDAERGMFEKSMDSVRELNKACPFMA